MSDSAHPPTPPATGTRSFQQRVIEEIKHAPAWARKNPLRAGLTLGIVVTAPLTLLVMGWWFQGSTPLAPITIDQALTALDGGEHDQARRIAMQVRATPDLSYREMGGPLYVLGLTIARDADEHWNAGERRLLYLVAAKYLQEAKAREFPATREEEGEYQLGRSWFLAGEPAKSIAVFKPYAKKPTPRRADALRMLAESCLQLDPPRYQDSLQYNGELLSDQAITTKQRGDALLRQCRIHLAQGNLAGCRRAIEQIPAESISPLEAATVGSQLLLAEGDAAQNADQPQPEAAKLRYEQAVLVLRSLRGSEGADPPVASQYLLGVALERLGDQKGAEVQYSRVRRTYSGSPEKVAAAVREAEMLASRDEYPEAVRLLRKALADAEQLSPRLNPWLPSADLVKRVVALQRGLVEQEEFDTALELATISPGVIEPWQLVLWKTEAYVARASATERDAAALSLDKAELQRAKARADRRLAAREFARLAELRKTTRDYADDLWNCSEQYFIGRDYLRTIKATREYLANESQNRRPDALLQLGEALLAADQVDQAIAVLTECLEMYPKHPATYRARLVAAQAYAERGLIAEARQQLLSNVENDILSPRSTQWRDSLFLLGKLLHREGVQWETKSRGVGLESEEPERIRASLRDLEQSHASYREAVKQLSKAVERYPDAPQSREGQYLLADSYRRAAKWPRKRLTVVTVEATRAALARQSQQDLLAAVAEYDKLIAQLGDVQDSPNHTQLEKRILRNGYFSKADALFDLGRYEDAIKGYSAATNRYQDEPESLEAYVQIASCYCLLDRQNEARGTLEQAKVVLGRMKPDVDFSRATPYSRDEWGQLLTWLATL